MSQGEHRPGRRRRGVPVGVLGAAVIVWSLVVVAWPRLSLGAPVARQVVMSTVSLDADDPAHCRTGVVSSWHDDRVTYYAHTGCAGLDADAVAVTVEGPEGHRESFACHDADQPVLGCAAREVEGTLRCGERCGEAVLTVTHRVQLPSEPAAANLEATSCAVDGRRLSCSYQVTMATLSITNVWSSAGEDHACVTRPVGEQRMRLDAVGGTPTDRVLLGTPAGPVTVEAVPEAVRGVLAVTDGIPEVAEADVPGQCRDGASRSATAG